MEEIRNHDLVQPDHSWLREHLGFLTDPHEINVGITRAKYGLIIIGMWIYNGLTGHKSWSLLLGSEITLLLASTDQNSVVVHAHIVSCQMFVVLALNTSVC